MKLLRCGDWVISCGYVMLVVGVVIRVGVGLIRRVRRRRSDLYSRWYLGRADQLVRPFLGEGVRCSYAEWDSSLGGG